MPGSTSSHRELRSALEGLFPRDVAFGLVQGEESVGALFPEEVQAMAGAVRKRRREFGRGRHCAREALAGVGYRPGPIPVGRDRAPIWPEGVVGSITHCGSLGIAVVGPRIRFSGLGLDAETATPLDEAIVGDVCTEREQEALDGLSPPSGGVDWPKLAFSAKEAIYKAVAGGSPTWLGFLDVEVRFDPVHRHFGARLVGRPGGAPLDLSRLQGRYAVVGSFVLAGATIPGIPGAPDRGLLLPG